MVVLVVRLRRRLWFNFAVVGVLAVFMTKALIFVTQSYMVVIGVLMATLWWWVCGV